jgi:Na+/H+ antiporter NhaC
VSRATGGVEAVVALGLSVIPAALILPGIFLLATAIALALGTSMGTIAAVAPIALGLADAASLDKALVLGAVLSGATCGDNLSLISDTAIAAARSQGTTVRAKFLENLKFAVPAALGTLVLLAFAGDAQPVPPADPPSAWLALPYVAVLGLAVLGVNVLAVLAIGVLLAGAFGLGFADYGVLGFTADVHKGFLSVTDTVLVSLFVAGLGALIRADGGFAWFVARIEALARGRKGPRVGQLGIAGLVAGSDALLANNTVAILLSGPIAKDIAAEHGVSPARAASLLDIFACVTQSLLPWGAQILLAASLGGISPLDLAGSLHYCWLLGGLTLAWVLFERRRSGAEDPAQVGEVLLQ